VKNIQNNLIPVWKTQRSPYEMSEPSVWRKSNSTAHQLQRQQKERQLQENDQPGSLHRYDTPNYWKGSVQSERMPEQTEPKVQILAKHPDLDLSIISQQNQSKVSSHPNKDPIQKSAASSHFVRVKFDSDEQTSRSKMDALKVLLYNLDETETPSINHAGSITTFALDHSDRSNGGSNLLSVRTGGVHSTVSVPQTLHDKDLFIKLAKIKNEKVQELKESKYFLLRTRLEEMNKMLKHLKHNERSLSVEKAALNSKNANPGSQYQADHSLKVIPIQLQSDSIIQELVSKLDRSTQSVEGLENKLKVSKCRNALLEVQIGILEEGFLSPNLSGSKANNTREVAEIKSQALNVIKSVILGSFRW
jgi:hypothetical protein